MLHDDLSTPDRTRRSRFAARFTSLLSRVVVVRNDVESASAGLGSPPATPSTPARDAPGTPAAQEPLSSRALRQHCSPALSLMAVSVLMVLLLDNPEARAALERQEHFTLQPAVSLDGGLRSVVGDVPLLNGAAGVGEVGEQRAAGEAVNDEAPQGQLAEAAAAEALERRAARR